MKAITVRLSEIPGAIADYTIGVFIVMTFLTAAEHRSRVDADRPDQTRRNR